MRISRAPSPGNNFELFDLWFRHAQLAGTMRRFCHFWRLGGSKGSGHGDFDAEEPPYGRSQGRRAAERACIFLFLSVPPRIPPGQDESSTWVIPGKEKIEAE